MGQASKPSRRRGTIPFVVALFLVVPYVACDGEHKVLDDTVRQSAGGSYALLADGITHYEIGGPESGQRVVLIHGASGPMAVWDHTFAALVAAGFRVLRYDLFGRGFSDRPHIDYTRDLFDRQLEWVLDTVDWNGPVDVVGSSMGGIISATFATRHPGRVRRVCLIGPAGFPIDAPLLAKAIPVPFLGDWAMTVFGDHMLAAHNQKYYCDPSRYPEAHIKFNEQLEYKGYKSAILSTMREMPMNDFVAGYRALGALGKPILLLWGTCDRTFPFSNFEPTKALFPGGEYQAIDAAGHVPQYEQPEAVSRAIAAFLTKT